ncbi:uncharacterized protein LOC110642382 [Hevea brasiliensis]|uniref:uncharacterized protein LOC110642382 n=1 Tax=Hevea brasiliensis TaxID=3981 RepID=UPI0025E8BD5F|nr:uncharacterized protein LOC110642382 [Hevea brasiliensis]
MLKYNLGLSEAYFISSFINGLSEELRPVIKMFRPESLLQAFEQAKLQEQSIEAILRKQKPYIRPYFNSYNTRNAQFRNANPTSKPNFSTANPSSSFSKPIFVAELEKPPSKFINSDLKKGNNSCFKCGDRYYPGHQCKTQQILALQADEEGLEEVGNMGGEENYEGEGEEVEISLHALDGSISPNTLKIKGKVDKQSIVILIDSGSTPSFLDYKIAKELGCRMVKAPPLSVTVANGHKMGSRFKCVGFCGIWRVIPSFST